MNGYSIVSTPNGDDAEPMVVFAVCPSVNGVCPSVNAVCPGANLVCELYCACIPDTDPSCFNATCVNPTCYPTCPGL